MPFNLLLVILLSFTLDAKRNRYWNKTKCATTGNVALVNIFEGPESVNILPLGLPCYLHVQLKKNTK